MEETNLGLLLKKEKEKKRMEKEINMVNDVTSSMEYAIMNDSILAINMTLSDLGDKFIDMKEKISVLDENCKTQFNLLAKHDRLINEDIMFVFDWLVTKGNYNRLESIIYLFTDGIHEMIQELSDRVSSMNWFERIIHRREVKTLNIRIETLQSLLYIYTTHFYKS